MPDAPPNHAIAVIGHGSLHPGSGAAMLRLAARLRERGLAPLAAGGFLNFSQPRFDATIERCVRRGATEVSVLPYFLIDGYFVEVTLEGLIEQSRARYPGVRFWRGAALGDHPAMARLAASRAAEADANPAAEPRGLVLLAHGSPQPPTEDPIERVAARLAAQGDFAGVAVGYLDHQSPTIAAAVDGLLASGLRRVVAVPYFLQWGGHVRSDLPAAIAACRAANPAATILLSRYLGYDPLLADALADRFRDLHQAPAYARG